MMTAAGLGSAGAAVTQNLRLTVTVGPPGDALGPTSVTVTPGHLWHSRCNSKPILTRRGFKTIQLIFLCLF